MVYNIYVERMSILSEVSIFRTTNTALEIPNFFFEYSMIRMTYISVNLEYTLS